MLTLCVFPIYITHACIMYDCRGPPACLSCAGTGSREEEKKGDSVASRPTRRRAMVAEQGGLGGREALENTRRCSHCSTSRDDAPGRTTFVGS